MQGTPYDAATTAVQVKMGEALYAAGERDAVLQVYWHVGLVGPAWESIAQSQLQLALRCGLTKLAAHVRIFPQSTDPALVQRLIADAHEAVGFIGGHIVQGVMNERGNLAVKIEEEARIQMPGFSRTRLLSLVSAHTNVCEDPGDRRG